MTPPINILARALDAEKVLAWGEEFLKVFPAKIFHWKEIINSSAEQFSFQQIQNLLL